MPTTDLYIGGDLAPFVLSLVSPTEVNAVVSTEHDIVDMATRLGFKGLHDAGTPQGESRRPPVIPAPSADAAISVHFPRIFPSGAIARYDKMYNLHPGYLPWGRGFFPMAWALWEETPAGATLHEISAQVDQGPIVAQTRVEYSDDDTWWTLFGRIREAERDLFRAWWPPISSGDYPPAIPQPLGGSYHSRKDFLALKRTTGLTKCDARTLLRLVRALTFPGFSGLELDLHGRWYSLGLEPLDAALGVGQ